MGRHKKDFIPLPLGVKLARGDVVEAAGDESKRFASVRLITKNADTQLKLFNKVKKYTKAYEGTSYQPTSFTLYFKNNDEKPRIINRQIMLKDITNKKGKLDNQLFTKQLKEIHKPSEEGGSDIDQQDYEQDYARLAINYKIGKIKGVGNAKGVNVYHPFKTENLENYEDGYCGWKCFQKMKGYSIPKQTWSEKKLRNISNLRAYLREKFIPVVIIDACSQVKAINRPFDIITSANKLWKLTKDDFEKPEIIYEHNEIKRQYYLVYSQAYQHYDVCKEIEFKDNILMNEEGIFYEKNGEKYMPCKNQKVIKASEDEIVEDKSDIYYIFLDIETVRDYTNYDINIPYSCSITVMQEDELVKLDELEKEYSTNPKKDFTSEINKIIKKHCYMFHGYNCLNEVYDYIEANEKNKKFIVYTFNGASFDHYLMYKTGLKRNNNPIYEPPIMAGGQMLQFSYNKKHIFKDIRKYTMGSLKGNCEGYQIQLFAKKEGFSHYEVQIEYNKGKDELQKWITNNYDKLFEYNTYDTLALAVLYYRVRTALEECIAEFNEDINVENNEKYILVDNNMTLGMFMKAVFDRHIIRNNNDDKKKKIFLPKFSVCNKQSEMTSEEKEEMLQFYRDMVHDRIGGRCELFNGDMRLKEHIASLDVCSLYPYVMFCADNYYPCGRAQECCNIDEMPKNKIGFFYCSVDQTNMTIPFIPRKTEEGNDWQAKIIERVLLDTVSIKYIIDNGGKVDVGNGYYYTDIRKGIELFTFLADIMKKKNEQDIYETNKDAKYNPALRATYKLCLNILSGKLNQGMNLDKLEFMNEDQYAKHVLTKGNKYPINSIAEGPYKKCLVKYEKTEEECLARASPIQIGYMIYVYARKYMHEHMYSKCAAKELIYTDTDSNKLRVPEFNKWVDNYGSKIIVPHCKEILKYDKRFANHKLYESNTKVFGSFEDEYKKYVITDSYFLQKKFYYLEATKDGKPKDIIHCKGMCKNDIVLPMDFDDEAPTEVREEIRNTQQHNGIKYKTIKDNPKAFYKKLFKERTCKVLTFSMKKHYGNLKRDVHINDKENMNPFYSSVSAVYPIKTITIKDFIKDDETIPDSTCNDD